jgi:hypothetical protein
VVSLNASSSPPYTLFHLSLSIPKSSNVFTSYLCLVDITLHIPSSSSMNELFSNYQLCLLFSDSRDHCHHINRLYQSYKIAFSHESNVLSSIDFHLCPITVKNSDNCRSSSISSINFIAKPPHMEITRELWSFLVPSEEFYLNHRIGIVIGSVPSLHLPHFIGVSDDLRIITSSPSASASSFSSLEFCRNEIFGRIVECCDLHRPIHQCLPPVADVGVIIIDREFIRKSWKPPMIDKFISTLSLINGRALFLSSDLEFFQILELFPEDIRRLMTLLPLSVEPISLREHYQTILLVDLTSLWLRRDHQPTLRSLQSLTPSQMSTSFSYGQDYVTLKNVCLMNTTSIIFLPSFSPSSSSSGDPNPDHISEDFLSLLQRRYPNWSFHKNSHNLSSLIPFISQTTLATVPPITYSIYHLVQTLLPILHSLHQPSSPASAWIHQLQSHFLFLFPTIWRDDSQWTFQFISLIQSFIAQHLQNITSSSASPSSSTPHGPKILFSEDLHDLTALSSSPSSSSSQQSYRYRYHSSDSLNNNKESPSEAASTAEIIPNTLCFEQLILLSHAHISTPFLNDLVEANAFRRYAYDWIADSILSDGSYFDSAVSQRAVRSNELTSPPAPAPRADVDSKAQQQPSIQQRRDTAAAVPTVTVTVVITETALTESVVDTESSSTDYSHQSSSQSSYPQS